MYTVLKLFQPFEGNRVADVAPGENKFDTPALNDKGVWISICEDIASQGYRPL